jgi:selenide,water dikinase
MLEMLDAARLSARIDPGAIPLLPGFLDVTSRGFLSSLHEGNSRVACRVAGEPYPWLFDPQTSGGLLAAVSPAVADSICRELQASGYSHATIIGEVVDETEAPRIHLKEAGNGTVRALTGSRQPLKASLG